MEFLEKPEGHKIIRTSLYGDQEISLWELEILHTPVMQRLYNLKQLGFTDRVYPDAVHSRLNHVLGVVEMVERMAARLKKWLKRNGQATFDYSISTSGGTYEVAKVTADDLETLLSERIPVIRLMALLHDITHAAFGHTLEDEVCLFEEKHDSPPRQRRFFDALVAQLLYIWVTELQLHVPEPSIMESLTQLLFSRDAAVKWAEDISAKIEPVHRQRLSACLLELNLAMALLLHLEVAHQVNLGPLPEFPSLLAFEVAQVIDPRRGPTFVFNRDLYLVDIVGNTICADLLDYARRDAVNAGLKVQFDERILRYLCVVSVRDELSPTRAPCIRLGIQFFTDKMRHDVLSEMSAILKARYLINERVIFHPTKCAAGAVLGTAVQLLGLAHIPDWLQPAGDQEFLSTLNDVAHGLAHIATSAHRELNAEWEDLIPKVNRRSPIAGVVRECLLKILKEEGAGSAISLRDIQRLERRVAAGRRLLWRLDARRFPKLAYRLRVGLNHPGGDSDETIANDYCLAKKRYDLERKIERTCNLPTGAIVIHCPRRRTSMKVAEVLVVGADASKVAKLRSVTSVSPEGLGPYEAEIRAIEEMYKSIWQFHVYLESPHFDKQPVVAWALQNELKFPNDPLLVKELASGPPTVYRDLAGDLRDEIVPNRLSYVIERVDREFVKMRLEKPQDRRELLRSLIHEVNSEDSRVESDAQLGLPGIE